VSSSSSSSLSPSSSTSNNTSTDENTEGGDEDTQDEDTSVEFSVDENTEGGDEEDTSVEFSVDGNNSDGRHPQSDDDTSVDFSVDGNNNNGSRQDSIRMYTIEEVDEEGDMNILSSPTMQGILESLSDNLSLQDWVIGHQIDAEPASEEEKEEEVLEEEDTDEEDTGPQLLALPAAGENVLRIDSHLPLSPTATPSLIGQVKGMILESGDTLMEQAQTLLLSAGSAAVDNVFNFLTDGGDDEDDEDTGNDTAPRLEAPPYEPPAEEEKEEVEDTGLQLVASPVQQIEPLPLSPTTDQVTDQFRGVVVSVHDLSFSPLAANNTLSIEAADTQEGEATSLALLSNCSDIGSVFTFSGNGDEDTAGDGDGDEDTESEQQVVLADNRDTGKYEAMVAARSSSSSSSDEKEDEQEEKKVPVSPHGTVWYGQRRSSSRIRKKTEKKKKVD